MEKSRDASYADHCYLKYKLDLEGKQTESKVFDQSEVGIALFGLGRIGTIHLNNLRNPRAKILYCVEESEERTNFIRNKWKLSETTFLKTSDQDAVFQSSSVDAVVICTPTFTHEELVVKSLKSGKAVFCEKPLALDDAGIQFCLQAQKKCSKPLLCAFNRRFDPGFRNLKLRTESGEIGRVQILKTCSRDSPLPSIEYLKISGGIFHDCSVHDIDYICWVLNEYPLSVSSFAHTYFKGVQDLDDFDTVAISMKFPSGAIGIIDLSRHSVYGYDQRVEIFGSEGMLTSGVQRPISVECHTAKGSTAVPILYSFVSKYQESYIAEMEHFLDVAQGLDDCEVTLDSILAVYKIASACEKSARSGQTVSLKWDM